MTVREILKMGDPRLLRIAAPVTAFDTPELHALIADMRETMASCDHLIGKLYPMRVRDFTKFGYTEIIFPGINAAEDDSAVAQQGN